MKKFLECLKKYQVIIYILIGVLLIVVLGVSLFNNEPKKVSNEKELKELLETVGRAYYEEFYYPQVEGEVKKYSETGVASTLGNMKLSNVAKITENMDKFKNSLTDKECDMNKSKVKIIPLEPYGKSDYKIEVTLVCGFETQKESK